MFFVSCITLLAYYSSHKAYLNLPFIKSRDLFNVGGHDDDVWGENNIFTLPAVLEVYFRKIKEHTFFYALAISRFVLI